MVSRGALITVPVVCLIMFFVSQVLLQPFLRARGACRRPTTGVVSGFSVLLHPRRSRTATV